MPLLEKIISIVAPHHCLICGEQPSILCNACSVLEIKNVPPRCYKCQKSTKDSKTCQACRRKSKLVHVWVRTMYDETVSELLINYKFKRMRSAYKPIGGMISQTLPYLAEDTLVVSVPTSTSRRRERGYDHAALIAKDVAYSFGWEYAEAAVRIGQAHQFGSGRKQRLKQLENAFYVHKPQVVKGRKVLIVDDVLTTGATLETFASALKKAGAKSIDGAVFAQKL